MAFDNCPFDITPLGQSKSINVSPIVNLNYTNQDFWSLKSRLVDEIQQRFADKFNDLVEGDLAIMLIENWAFIADTLSFKIDQIANEVFIDTVTEVENAFRLSKLVGFRPQPPIASRSLWSATMNNVLTTDLRIPPGVGVNVSSGSGPIRIELFTADSNWNPIFDQDIVIPAGSLSVSNIIGLEGQTASDTFQGTGGVGQTIALTLSPVIWNSVQVEVDGVRWQEVEYFTDSNPRQEYRVEFNSQYEAFVIFGNNRSGLIPSRGSQIRVTYRRGGGTQGNIVTGSVESQRTFPNESLQLAIPVSFRNYTRGEYGYNGDTIEDIRRKLPAYLRTQNRCVTALDYKTIADQFATPYSGQVGKSVAILRNYGCAANIIDLYVLARDSDGSSDSLTIASPGLKSALQEEIESKKMINNHVCIRDGIALEVDVYIDLVIDKFYRKFEDELRVKIERRLDSFFALGSWEYGQNLKDTNIIKVLSDLREIKNLEITFSTNNPDNGGQTVTTRFYEIIRPSSLTISFIYE